VSATDLSPSRIRWSSRTFLLLAVGIALLLIAVGTRTSALIFFGLPLLVVPFVAALGSPRRAVVADLTWQAGGAGPSVEVSGTVHARHGGDISQVAITFETPADLEEAAPPTLRYRADAIDFALRWWAPHPMIGRVPPPSISWKDPLGLVEREVEGERPTLIFERYPPELHRLGTVRLDRTLLLPGEARSHRVGASGEFFGIRDAAPDDPPRRINWRATARVGRRLSNEFELDRTGDILLLVDTRSVLLGPAVDDALIAVARAAATGISAAFLREKARVGFATFGEFVDAVPMATGRGHRLRLQAAIMAMRRSEVAGPSERCAATLNRFYPPGITTILISPLTGEADPDLLVYLRRRGYPAIVLSPSPLSLPVPHAALAPEAAELAQRLGALARRRRIARLWSHSPVIDWSDFWSFGELVRVLRQPSRRRVG